jgi:hypothetical protein
MSESEYSVKIEGDGRTFEWQVTQEVAQQIILLAVTGTLPHIQHKAKSTSAIGGAAEERNGSAGAVPQDSEEVALSIREFMDEYEPKRNPDKITAMGLYLKTYRNQPVFSRSDIAEAYQAAAEPVPANLTRDIRWATRIGWIAERPGEPDAYYVTDSGTRIARNKFPDDAIKRTPKPRGSRRRSTKQQEEGEE